MSKTKAAWANTPPEVGVRALYMPEWVSKETDPYWYGAVIRWPVKADRAVVIPESSYKTRLALARGAEWVSVPEAWAAAAEVDASSPEEAGS